MSDYQRGISSKSTKGKVLARCFRAAKLLELCKKKQLTIKKQQQSNGASLGISQILLFLHMFKNVFEHISITYSPC